MRTSTHSHYGQAYVSQGLQTANTTHKCRPGAHRAPINNLGIDYHQYCSSSDPYPHPQHMKVVKHLSYVWRGCVNHSMWVWSLKQCTSGSFSAKQRTKILDDFSNLEQQVWWVWHDDGSISPSTAYEGCQTPFIGFGVDV